MPLLISFRTAPKCEALPLTAILLKGGSLSLGGRMLQGSQLYTGPRNHSKGLEKVDDYINPSETEEKKIDQLHLRASRNFWHKATLAVLASCWGARHNTRPFVSNS